MQLSVNNQISQNVIISFESFKHTWQILVSLSTQLVFDLKHGWDRSLKIDEPLKLWHQDCEIQRQKCNIPADVQSQLNDSSLISVSKQRCEEECVRSEGGMRQLNKEAGEGVF